MTQILNGEKAEQCFWQLPTRCQNKSQWQVEATDKLAARVCHGHLLDTCQTWAESAPLTVNPIFANWGVGLIE